MMEEKNPRKDLLRVSNIRWTEWVCACASNKQTMAKKQTAYYCGCINRNKHPKANQHTHTNNMFHPNRQPRCTFGMDAAQTLCMEENEVKEKSALILTNNTESRPKHQNKS